MLRGPKYDDNSIKLSSKNISTTSILSTQYSIKYNFKVGYNYKISVFYKGEKDASDNFYPRFGLKISSTDGGIDPTTDCTNPASISSTSTFTQGDSGPTYAWTTNNFFDVTITQNADYLLVGGFPYPGTTKTGYVWIRKIQIVETPPPGAFSISPTSSQIICGSTTPVTFTINNNNNTTGITAYKWNLGATPNGWIYNGSPAPASIPITSTSLSPLVLTPDCGKALTNISATVTANSINYNTSNSSIISITQPLYSISGNSSLCNGSTDYTLNGLVCNSLIAWTAPPSNLGTLSSLTSSPTALTYGGTSGNFTLTANITSCGVATPVTLPVHVGVYTSSDYTLSGNNGSTYYCTNQTISFGVSGGPATNYVWSIPSGWSIVYNGGSYVALRSPSSSYPPTGTVSVSFTEPCGATVTKSKFLAYSSSACNTSDPRFKIYPNPASSYINVEVDLALPNNSNTHIVGVQLLNQSAILVYNQSYPNNPGNFYQGVQIPVYNQVNGNYTLRVYDGTTWVTYAVVVQH